MKITNNNVSNMITLKIKDYQVVWTTMENVFSVNYYLKSCNAIIIYCMSHVLSTKLKLVVWTLENNTVFTL